MQRNLTSIQKAQIRTTAAIDAFLASGGQIQQLDHTASAYNKVKPKLKRNQGESNSMSKLTKANVREIRRVIDSLKTNRDKVAAKHEFAKRFNVSYACIHEIVVGKNWQEVQ